MSVIQYSGEPNSPAKPKCNCCGEEPGFPYLHWMGHYQDDHTNGDIIICGECCRNIESGFIADLVQVIAIGKMRAAWTAQYRNTNRKNFPTLQRISVEKYAERDQETMERDRGTREDPRPARPPVVRPSPRPAPRLAPRPASTKVAPPKPQAPPRPRLVSPPNGGDPSPDGNPTAA